MTERTALVTGGASGIGREICLALAADGRKVAVADIQRAAADETAHLITEAGGTAMALTMDITDREAVDSGSYRYGICDDSSGRWRGFVGSKDSQWCVLADRCPSTSS
ncbi:MAG: SDR family NAD(P)-dependent oxidoreductase, partial [Actinomycetota bacterium]